MTKTLYRKVLEQRLDDTARETDKLDRKLRAAKGMESLRCFEAIVGLEQERRDLAARLRELESGRDRLRDAIRFEIEHMTDDVAHGMARWIARLDAHFVGD
ncbi:MAG: hypothetical protein KGL11_10090 [Alphaproteobacteria bacterium]|nr:hypothetical protein [Alphaproteobacteria bacterium]